MTPNVVDDCSPSAELPAKGFVLAFVEDKCLRADDWLSHMYIFRKNTEPFVSFARYCRNPRFVERL
jgi:hypothetical protein